MNKLVLKLNDIFETQASIFQKLQEKLEINSNLQQLSFILYTTKWGFLHVLHDVIVCYQKLFDKLLIKRTLKGPGYLRDKLACQDV